MENKFEINGITYIIYKILIPKNLNYKYVVYYPENDKENYMVSRFSLENGQYVLEPVIEDTEWNYIVFNV